MDNARRQHILIRISTVSYSAADFQPLADSIRAAGVSDALSFRIDHLSHFFVDAAIATGAILGKKAIDIIAELVKQWLETHQEAESVTIYGPDGKAAKTIKRKNKETDDTVKL